MRPLAKIFAMVELDIGRSNNDQQHRMKKSDMTSSWWEQVLLIAGVPLNEPIARYGPFVMNTETEIHQAFEDYRRGRMGAIKS